jgi:hypothetical protein
VISLWLAAAVAVADPESYPTNAIAVQRAAIPPVIDGRLDDPAWLEADPVSDFHQQRPEYREPATEDTRVRVTYDDDYFYIAAELFDREPGQIRATQLVRG